MKRTLMILLMLTAGTAVTAQADTRVDLTVHDLRGRLVRTLAAGELAAGRHDLVWDGKTDHGAGAASGVYFLRLTAAGFAEQRKLVMAR